MRMEIHRASERGVGEHGWLHARHSFSFANYFNPNRMGFGALRVLNEDIVDPGYGFGLHSHADMEIVTIILEGALEHKDNTGHSEIIRAGDVQRMSAGTGITHSEMNLSESERVHLLQIWIVPKEKNIAPSYEQKTFSADSMRNTLCKIVSGEKTSGSIYIHQDAAFLTGRLDENVSVSYTLRSAEHGLYVFVISGELKMDKTRLKNGDAAAVRGTEGILMTAAKSSHILVMEVPLLQGTGGGEKGTGN